MIYSWVPWFAIGHPPDKFIEPQTLKVLWRPDKSQLELFVIAQDKSIWSIWWSDFISGWQQCIKNEILKNIKKGYSKEEI